MNNDGEVGDRLANLDLYQISGIGNIQKNDEESYPLFFHPFFSFISFQNKPLYNQSEREARGESKG